MLTSLLTVNGRPLPAPLGKHDTSTHNRSYPTVAALKGLKQQSSCLAKCVKDLKREKEASFEQSSRRDFGEHPMHDNQWGYGNFAPHARSYDCDEGNRFRTRNDVGNGGNYVNMDERFHKRKGDCEDIMIVTTMEDIIMEKVLKLWELHQNLLVTVNVWWASKCENRRRKGAQPINTWSLMKQSLKNTFGVGNHEGQRQG
ncbi:hypothetical protein M9H77_31427 [Catharanthus roseus]|uniref:Uncharacterized protein n=1 Tax=Catharanthus roseus TaxID=4058 RepID=A0ACC0A137_CATRO|nr:hypothetical protein M9H77_31427 [Catharanthus roseus]